MAGKVRQAVADAGRLAFGFFYWNLRKAAFQRRGHRGRCPCHNESDDPIPGRVRCEAVLHYHDPARFRAVCPLLIRTADGWRCSVGPTGVRPFWGRLFGRLVPLSLGCYLLGTLVAFGAVRLTTGAPVGWGQFLWPAAWRQIPRVQAEHQFQLAIRAFAERRLDEAGLLLESARRRDPGHYEAGLLLAQIAMFQGSFRFADDLFTQLQRGHPAQRARTAITFHDTLLGLDRMHALAAHSLSMAQVDRDHAAIWVRSALMAIRSLPPGQLEEMAEQVQLAGPALAPHARQLLEAELALRAGNRTEALARYRRNFGGPYNPFYVTWQIERLAELGAPADAEAMLDQLGPILGDFEHLRLQATVAALAGDGWGERTALHALLRGTLTAAQAERLAAYLIEHPDLERQREFAARIRLEPALQAALGLPALWVTALACGDQEEARNWRTLSGDPATGGLPDLEKIDFTRRDVLRPDTALHLINTVSLPREVILALLWRTEAGREAQQIQAGLGR